MSPHPLAPLAAYRQFVLVKTVPLANGKTNKLPMSTTGAIVNAHDPAYWMSWAEAQTLADAWGPGHGIGFVLTEADPIWCIDLDNALSPAGWSPLAIEIFTALPGTAMEISQSGAGGHIWGQGPVPPHSKRNIALGLEFYSEARFILLGHSAVGDMSQPCPGIAAVAAKYFPPRVGGSLVLDEGPVPEWNGPTDDDALMRRALASKSDAATFGDGVSLVDLWEANADKLGKRWPSSTGQPWDGSSADMALASRLAFWTGRDKARIERLMRRSALMREKWGDRHDYLARTITRACEQCETVFGASRAISGPDESPYQAPACNDLTAAEEVLPRFRLLDGAALRNLPPIEWRVRGVLPAEGVAALYGPSASGKSFLGFDLATAIAEGRRWFDRKVEAAPAVYVVLEGGAGFKMRSEAWEKAYGRPLPAGMNLTMQSFKITDPKDVRDLASVVPAGAVVFIDTLNRAAPTTDENSSSGMGEILEGTKQLQELTKGLVVLVHHTGKDESKGARGHSSLFAAIDCAIVVIREGARKAWRAVKVKDGEEGMEVPFCLDPVILGEDDEGDPITSCVVRPGQSPQVATRSKLPKGGNQKIVLDALDDLLRESQSTGKGGAPVHLACVEVEAAVEAISGRLACEPKRRTERTRQALTGLISTSQISIRDGWLWRT